MTEDHDRLTQRVIELETLFTHLQRTVQDLNQVVLQQHSRLELLETKLRQAAADVESLTAAGPQPADPRDERPPHY